MKVTILGCGGSGGVPMLSVGWGRCDPDEPRNRRTRASIVIETGTASEAGSGAENGAKNGARGESASRTILIDTSPDLRAQLLDTRVRRIDAVLYTHAHADHINGIDDLREINRVMGGPIPAYADRATLDRLERSFGHVLEAPEGGQIYKTWLEPHEIAPGPFSIAGIEAIAVDQDHGHMRTLGFRFGDFAYSTDVVTLPEASLAALRGVKVWIVGALTDTPHPTHAHVDKAVGWMTDLGVACGVISHMSPRLDYARLCRDLPSHIRPAYDGMVIEI